jgi:SAM-dependent methyltransferase
MSTHPRSSDRAIVPSPSRGLRQLLASRLVWKLTGLTYATAVIATRGGLRTPTEYIEESARQMRDACSSFQLNGQVLELGCGIGGNLVAISRVIRKGVGLDVNRGYLRIADYLAKKSESTNLDFVLYDGAVIPFEQQSFDAVYSIGVFERLDRLRVQNLLSQLYGVTRANGTGMVFFLTDRARGTDFVKFIGEAAYVFWTDEQALKQCRECGWTVSDEPIPFGNARVLRSGERVNPGVILILHKLRTPQGKTVEQQRSSVQRRAGY